MRVGFKSSWYRAKAEMTEQALKQLRIEQEISEEARQKLDATIAEYRAKRRGKPADDEQDKLAS
jgi:hypothetical protein